MNTRPKPPFLAISALVALVACIMLISFAWPAVNTGPHHLPLAVVAPAPVAAQLEARLDTARPGAFDLQPKISEAEARAAILNREVYGALLITPQGPKVLTASAASPAAAQLVAALPALMGAPAGPDTVEDIVPATASDARQSGLGGAALPLVLCGMLSAALLTQLYTGVGARLGGLAGVALLGGFGVTAILQFWFGTLGGEYWLNSLVVALGIAAIGALVQGLESVLGTVGLALGGVSMVLIANPLSALTSAPELLPAGWGAFGQALPPGAFGTLLRSVAFFDGAGSSTALLTLVVWVLGGLGLVVMGTVRRRAVAPVVAQGA
ncbi:ABC transporter permease [Deinococcus saxicola]|uniref:hypothetical protein n=1 Tax=Deinococcus saxicola TaxID=249406 RepID=UPI0039EDFDA4